MLSLSVFFVFMGFYFLYITSQRSVYTSSLNVYKWGKDNPSKSKLIGGFCLLIGLVLELIVLGFGSGIFSFFVVLMTFGSLIVLISPTKFFSTKSLLIIAVLSILLEINI